MNDDPSILSVSQAASLIQRSLSQNFSNVKIKGEISGLKRPASGHLYFDLKDEGGAVLNAICWRGTTSRIKVKPEDGLEIIASGSITTYPQRSNYQIIVNNLEISGVGTLMAMLEERKKKLLAEGLFAAENKRSLPFLPQTIGVITSPTGAVIQDILHRLEDRFGVNVLLYPVKVQGDGAAEEITAGIEFFNGLPAKTGVQNPASITRPDLLIVARGGGSLEDLWAFNEENVVRAAANSQIPLISAVGHETDTTLIDFASDRRAPTPTAAAEMAVPVKAELIAGLMEQKQRIFNAANNYINIKKQYVAGLARGLVSPNQILQNHTQRLDDSTERLKVAMQRIITEKQRDIARVELRPNLLDRLLDARQNELQNYKKLLASYSYKNVLGRGFSVVRGKSGKIVTSKNGLNTGDAINIEFADGNARAEILNSEGSRAPHNKALASSDKPKVKKAKKGNINSAQESLF